MYPYGLNEKVYPICKDDKSVKEFKSDDDIVEKFFPAYLDYFKRTKHVDMTTGREYLLQIINNL